MADIANTIWFIELFAIRIDISLPESGISLASVRFIECPN